MLYLDQGGSGRRYLQSSQAPHHPGLLLRRGPAKLGHVAQLTLHTERLRLVPLADEHLQFEIELDSDPEVMKYITGRALSPDEVERAHRRRLAAADEVPGLGLWAGFADDEFVGWWILQPPNGPDQPRVAGEGDLGYRLLRRHWRRGCASEGARELIRYGFEDVSLMDLRSADGSQCRITGHHGGCRADLHAGVRLR